MSRNVFHNAHIKYGFSISEIDFWVEIPWLEACGHMVQHTDLYLNIYCLCIKQQQSTDRPFNSIWYLPRFILLLLLICLPCVCVRLTVMYPFQWWIGNFRSHLTIPWWDQTFIHWHYIGFQFILSMFMSMEEERMNAFNEYIYLNVFTFTQKYIIMQWLEDIIVQ